VFKKLDILIIKAFIGPFVATFFITLLVLVMQFFWLYIDDFVGKGLPTGIIFKFIWYQSAVLVPLALPLAILLSSLMTFGNLGESFELVAIKSAGISFMFSNYIIPVANLKSRTLLTDIVYAKPSFDLKEGVFYDKINGFAIKIGKKEPNDSVIRDVIVYEQGNPIQDNFIIAKSGVMRVTDNKRFLEFDLKDGWRYQERGDNYYGAQTEYIRLNFKEYKKQFDLSSFQINWTPDSVNKNNERMFSMRQLTKAIDSLKKELTEFKKNADNELGRQVQFAGFLDTGWVKKNVSDTAKEKTFKKFDEVLPDSARISINQRVENLAASLRISTESTQITLKDKEKNLRKHKIEWHRKITLSLACLVLFLIGAPLGSIIRKGGLGTPLIFAIIFFMIFYFTSTMGEKFAKENTLTPVTGMWLATFILLPMGLFLTYKAMNDSRLLNRDSYSRAIRLFKKLFGKKANG
jgi:lipopolysaccharide export system permease protein